MAHSQRGWTGARTPSAVKRVRQTERRRLINQPRRTEAKTLVGKAMLAATDAANTGSPEEIRAAVERAVSALDRAAKQGAIHRNAADRRKSRLMLKVNAALGGEATTTSAKVARQTSKAAAAKEAKARIAAGRAAKAKGAQTAAGKARAALAKTSRDASAEKAAATAATSAVEAKPAKAATKSSAKSSTAKSSTAKSTTAKAASKSTKTASKSSASKSAASKTAKKS